MSSNYQFLDLLEKIRELDSSTKKLRIQSVTVNPTTQTVKVAVICDTVLTEQTIVEIEGLISSYMPISFKKVQVESKKVKADADLVKSAVLNKILSSFKYISGSISAQDILVTMGEKIRINFSLTPSLKTLFTSNKIADKIIDFLSSEFCEDFIVETTFKQGESVELDEEESDIADFLTVKVRTLQVNNVHSYISYDNCDTAVYIADAVNMRKELYVCGLITGIREMQTSKGKPMFLIDFTDKTGRLTGRYFPSEKKVKTVQLLKEGEGIILFGEMGEFNGRADFRIKNIGLCDFPEDFVPERLPSKPVPTKYKKIFPQELEDTTQINIFKANDFVPDCLIGKTFVVFDLETTGLDTINDKITEIGAVKIVDGKICDCFTTLINPQVPISARITELTGITDEMVADKPVFSEVIGDFFKYIDGVTLIAHNASFDVNFIKKAAEKEGYYVENEYLDTMEIARKEVLGLKNYKLNTICDHFGIEFLHHRAMSDAHATAKMFLEIIKLKKRLPN